MAYIGNPPAPQNITSSEITDGTIVNVDIASDAAIAATKIAGLSTVATTGAYSDVTGTPTLATVATTGAYSDLSGTPSLVSSLADLGVTASAADLNTTDITTLGTVEASKVVTADANGDVTFPDGEKLKLGTSGDLEVYHDGSNSYIADYGTGVLSIASDGAAIQLSTNTGELMAYFAKDGAAQLFYDNSKKIETTSVGADVTGELIADSYNETYSAVTSTINATTVNCETGNSFSHTLTENTTFTFSNPPASGTSYTFSIEIIQDASASGFTVTWPTSVDWPAATAPTLTATASAKDIFVFTTRDGGTNWYGFTAGQALA